MLRFVRRTSLLLAVLAIGACNSSAPQDTTADVNAVNTVRTSWAEAFNAGDANRLGGLYASDAVVMPENAPAVSGRDAIVKLWGDMMAANATHVELTADETHVSGDWAFDRGQFTMTMTPKTEGAMPMTEKGKYLVVLHREADGWKIAREIGNSNAPMPPMNVPMPGMGDMPMKKM
jgi:uncharacterized protein (TIGR02246 family)